MKINAVEIRPGNILEYEGGVWKTVKIQHTQPGKGGAYMQVEMKKPSSTAARPTSASARPKAWRKCGSTPSISSICSAKATR